MADDEDWMFVDEDEEAFFAAWDEADREAAEVLAEACAAEMHSPPPRAVLDEAAARLRAGLERGAWPFDYWQRACGWDQDAPDDDVTLWVGALAATISPPEDPGTDVEGQSAVAALFHADWLGLVVGLVRRGVGAECSPEAAQRDIATLPEIEIEDDVDDPDGELAVLSMAITILSPLWQALGVIDDDGRLTALGRWGLPHGLLVTWSGPMVADAAEADEAAAGAAQDRLDD
jgi:hypothetical protein